MNNLLPSVVLMELARVADLSPSQALRIANWMLDHDVRYTANVAMQGGIPATLFVQLRELCLQGKRINAIKELRSWARETHGTFGINYTSFHVLGNLKEAKEYIDQHFPKPPETAGQS